MSLAASQDEAYQQQLLEFSRCPELGAITDNQLLLKSDGIIIVPYDDNLRTLLLSEAHDSLVAGHFGVKRTYEKLQRFWFWVGMKRDVENYLQSYVVFQRTKYDVGKTPRLLHPILALHPWHTVTLDLVEGFSPASDTGNTYYLIIVDKFTKYVLLESVPQSITAEQTARIFLRRVVAEFGAPVWVISD